MLLRISREFLKIKAETLTDDFARLVQGSPEDGQTARIGAGSGHVAGANVLMLDGAVRTYSNTIDPKLWRGLATYDDLETVETLQFDTDTPSELQQP